VAALRRRAWTRASATRRCGCAPPAARQAVHVHRRRRTRRSARPPLYAGEAGLHPELLRGWPLNRV